MFGIFKEAFKEAKEKLQQAKLQQAKLQQAKLQQAKRAQVELAVAFEAIGLNVTKMNPSIHNALLKEALATSPEKAAANFITALEAFKKSPPAMMLKHEGFEHFMLTEQGNSRTRSSIKLHRPSDAVLAKKFLREQCGANVVAAQATACPKAICRKAK